MIEKTMKRWIRLSLPLALLASVLISSSGCAKKAEEAPAETSSTASPAPSPASNASDTNVYKNAEGVAVCPVMDVPIPDVSKAVGFQDHKGVRYYFCCDMCPGKFKENPDLYAKK